MTTSEKIDQAWKHIGLSYLISWSIWIPLLLSSLGLIPIPEGVIFPLAIIATFGPTFAAFYLIRGDAEEGAKDLVKRAFDRCTSRNPTLLVILCEYYSRIILRNYRCDIRERTEKRSDTLESISCPTLHRLTTSRPVSWYPRVSRSSVSASSRPTPESRPEVWGGGYGAP